MECNLLIFFINTYVHIIAKPQQVTPTMIILFQSLKSILLIIFMSFIITFQCFVVMPCIIIKDWLSEKQYQSTFHIIQILQSILSQSILLINSTVSFTCKAVTDEISFRVNNISAANKEVDNRGLKQQPQNTLSDGRKRRVLLA